MFSLVIISLISVVEGHTQLVDYLRHRNLEAKFSPLVVVAQPPPDSKITFNLKVLKVLKRNMISSNTRTKLDELLSHHPKEHFAHPNIASVL